MRIVIVIPSNKLMDRDIGYGYSIDVWKSVCYSSQGWLINRIIRKCVWETLLRTRIGGEDVSLERLFVPMMFIRFHNW